MSEKFKATASEWKPKASATEFKPSWLQNEPTPSPPAPASAPAPEFIIEQQKQEEEVVEKETITKKEAAAVETPPVVVAKEKEETTDSTNIPTKAPTPPLASQNSQDNFDVSGFEKEQEEYLEYVKKGDLREHLNVVFIGHVDAGKSTLSGSILFEMGTVDKRTIEKFQQEAKDQNRESWFLAYIMDTNEEERAKGKTVEVGRAYFETENRRCTILDAPGHKNYVPAMISGAAQADVGVLVISARKGEFEAGFDGMGQTREHALLAKTLGIQKLIVVINKMDESTVNWSKDRYDQITKKLRPFLKNCGYKVKRDVIFMPIAALKGVNIKNKIGNDVDAAWAKEINGNKSLLETIDTLEISGRDISQPLRMTVLDRYQDRGTNLMGKIEAGALYTGQKICVCPNESIVKVDTISINDEEVEGAKPGENVLVRCSQLDENQVSKGHVVCSRYSPVQGCTEILAQLFIIGLLEHRPLFSAGYNAVFHAHTAEEECTVYEVVARIDTKTGKMVDKGRTPFGKEGQTIICKIRLEKSIVLEPYEKTQSLGRITLRDEGKTIAIGIIKRCK